MNEEEVQYERLRIEFLTALRESAIIERDTRDNLDYLEKRYPDFHGQTYEIQQAKEALEECIKTTDFYVRQLHRHLTEDEQ